jgi:hypothetical protein
MGKMAILGVVPGGEEIMKEDKAKAKILMQVRESFDTDKFGASLIAIDRLAEMRAELRIVHAKARGLVDDLHGLPGSDDRRPIWEIADGVMTAFGECVEKLKGVELQLEKLVYLDPKIEADELP